MNDITLTSITLAAAGKGGSILLGRKKGVDGCVIAKFEHFFALSMHHKIFIWRLSCEATQLNLLS